MTTGIISLFILILQSVVVMSPKVVNTYQIESKEEEEDLFTKNSGLPKLVCWPHALRSNQKDTKLF